MLLRLLLTSLCLLTSALGLPALAAEPHLKTIVSEASYAMGDSDTLAGAEEAVLNRAKRKAVEEGGVYIEALSQDVEKHADGKTTRLSSLSVRTLAAAITETEILDKKRVLENDRLVFSVKIKATVNLDTLEDAIKRQKAYEQLAEHHHLLHAENAQLKAELDELRKQSRGTRMVSIPRGQPLRNRKTASDLIHTAVRSRDLPEKIELATKAIAADDQYVDAYVVRGQTHLSIASLNAKKNTREELADYVDRAIADFDRALALDASSPWALLGLGDAYTWKKKPEEAAATYERILQVDPLFDVAQQRLIALRLSIARKQMAARQWRQALATLDALLPAHDLPGWTFHKREGYFLRGQVYTRLDKPQPAVDDLTTAIRMDPTNRPALLLRAKLYTRLQQGRLAKDDFDRACSLGSEDACAEVAHFSSSTAP